MKDFIIIMTCLVITAAIGVTVGFSIGKNVGYKECQSTCLEYSSHLVSHIPTLEGY